MKSLYAAGLFAALFAGGTCARIAQAQNVPPATGQKPKAGKPTSGKSAAPQQKGFTIGDVMVTFKGELAISGSGDVDFKGPNVRTETTDKQQETQMVVIADRVLGRRKTQGQESAQFLGNVRYTVHQKTKAGERVIQGTSESATYTAVNKTLRLSGNVNATLTDPTRFDAPATLRVGRLFVSESGSYQMTGEAATNDVRFTPHYEQVKPDAGRAAPVQVGTAHIYGFAKGVMEVGQSARFDGPQVTIDTANAPEKTQNVLKAPHIAAQLQENKQRIEATGGVQFNNRRADANDNVQAINGSADSALFVDAVREQDKATGKSKVITPASLDVSGDISATLTNPVSLREPATLIADHLVARLGDEPRYVITGAPARTRFTLAPRLASRQSKAGAASAVPNNAVPPIAVAPGKETPAQVVDSVALNNAVVQNTAAPANGGLPPNPNAGNQVAAPAPASPGRDADDQDDIANQPPDAGKAGKSAPPFVIGNLSASAFQTATYVPDKSLLVEGPEVRFTSSDARTKNYAEMQTPRLEVNFALNSVPGAAGKTRKVTTLTEMRATNGVTYKFQKPLPSGKTEMLTGKGRASVFTNGTQSQVVNVEGVSMGELTNPDISEQPFRLNANGGIEDKMSYDFLTRNFHMNIPNKDAKIVGYPRTDADAKPAPNSKPNAKKPANKKR